MKRLFLSSSFSEVKDLFNQFGNENYKGKRVTFIPTASLVEEVRFYVETGKEALESLGLVVDELDISTATNEEIDNKIKNNNFIYITGGNTFFLLQELKRTGADKLIIEQVNAGKIYIGESAGIIVLSPNIEYVTAMDDSSSAPNLESFSSLGLLDFYPIPHYKNFPFEESVDNIISRYESQLTLLPISNHQAIVVNDSEYEIWNSGA